MAWIKEKEIVELLRTKKWTIGQSYGFGCAFYWMQKGGLGRGGESKDIHGATFHSMIRKGLLRKRSSGDVGTKEYELNKA